MYLKSHHFLFLTLCHDSIDMYTSKENLIYSQRLTIGFLHCLSKLHLHFITSSIHQTLIWNFDMPRSCNFPFVLDVWFSLFKSDSIWHILQKNRRNPVKLFPCTRTRTQSIHLKFTELITRNWIISLLTVTKNKNQSLFIV